jgi:hypothetical protein
MPRQPMQEFAEGTELVRVYLASGLDEAKAAEAALDGVRVTYAVEVERYETRSILWSGERRGAGLWVVEADLDTAYGALLSAGLVKGLVDRGG